MLESIKEKIISVDEALNLVKSDDQIVTGLGASEGKLFLSNLHKLHGKVKNVTVNNCLPMQDYEFFVNPLYKDTFNLAGWFENFDVSKNGYYLNMEVKREKNDSFFDDGPEPFDFSNPENLSVTTDGRKVGAIVDYYDAFDEYLDEFTGTGYYEIKYQQMQRLVSIGKDPNAVDCIYSYEELSDMLSNDKGMGVK